jgi:regulator of protease activity HflC (stomatin/prohibitin superfamily)
MNGQIDEKKVVSAVILAFLIMVAILVTFRTVGAGEVGVVKRFGRITGRTLDPGIHVVVPLIDGVMRFDTKKVIYETTIAEKQKGSDADYKDYPVDTNTEDGQQVDIFYTVRFSIDPTKAGWVAQNIGSQEALVEKIVKTESRIWARNIPRRFTAESLYTGDGSQKVQDEIFNSLNETFESNGLILDGVGIREIKFTDAYITAIEQKQIQAVKVETEKNIAEQALYQKEARITQAEGLAREQELQRQTISPELLEKMWIERWNGILPVYMMGDSLPLIQLPN